MATILWRAALREGAAGVVVERTTGAPDELVVSDTLRAPARTGGVGAREWGGTVVGVTGSAGKTTTKDAIAHLLAVELPVGKTAGNFNNHMGVPLSILSLPDGCRAGRAGNRNEPRRARSARWPPSPGRTWGW